MPASTRIDPMSHPSARRPSSRPSAQARASCISLFAVLMMFIGPLISQSMPMDHQRSGMAMGSAMSGMDHAAHGEHHGSDADRGSGSGELHALMEKCGYCSLFFHCPALPQALGIAGATSQRPHRVFVARPRQGHATQAVFPGARTRAPPSMV